MSTPSREEALGRMMEAGRSLSDAIVLYHSVLAARLGLNPSHWKALGLLERYGPLTAGELSSKTGLAPASISGILDRLEEKQLVQRTADPQDGRRTRVELHMAGMGELQAQFTGLMRRLAELHEDYSAEELTFIADYMAAAAERQREATRELSGDPNEGE
jgi:DNA-binding MarR family transcriptional regulator